MRLSRRIFLCGGLGLMAGTPSALVARNDRASDAAGTRLPVAPSTSSHPRERVAIVSCKSYGAEVDTALRKGFDLLGGIGSLVKGKTVTVKVNLTGTNFRPYLGRPVGETYMTHYATARALAAAILAAGARRVRFVESTNRKELLETSLAHAGWDVKALQALGRVEFENTRNLGTGRTYAHLRVPNGGYLFDSFELNHCYAETDVMVSLCKLKQHLTAGVTLSMKNQFGLTPNSLYGDQAGSEEATSGRGVLHHPLGSGLKLPGFRPGATSPDPCLVPRVIVDICAARPIHLAIVDGIAAMTGAELPCDDGTFVAPGVLIVGYNPVSTDAVATAVMGYDDPRAPKGTAPFKNGENHLWLAEQAGLGSADLERIEIVGLPLDKACCPYPDA